MGLPLIYRRPNPLAFPGTRRPGFDPTHIAAGPKPRFSGTSSGANFNNLLNGKVGTAAGTPVPSTAIIGSLGRVTVFGVSANSTIVRFAGSPTTNDANVTIAVLVLLPSVGAGGTFFSTSATNSAWRLWNDAGDLALTAGGVADHKSTLGLIGNVPYFLVASGSSGNVNFLALRLDNGQVTTATTTGSAPTAPNGTYNVGNWDNSGLGGGNVAAAMFSAQYMSMGALLQWAQRPWDFWYPPTVEDLIFSSLVGASTPVVTVTNRFLPLMGVGR